MGDAAAGRPGGVKHLILEIYTTDTHTDTHLKQNIVGIAMT